MNDKYGEREKQIAALQAAWVGGYGDNEPVKGNNRKPNEYPQDTNKSQNYPAKLETQAERQAQYQAQYDALKTALRGGYLDDPIDQNSKQGREKLLNRRESPVSTKSLKRIDNPNEWHEEVTNIGQSFAKSMNNDNGNSKNDNLKLPPINQSGGGYNR